MFFFLSYLSLPSMMMNPPPDGGRNFRKTPGKNHVFLLLDGIIIHVRKRSIEIVIISAKEAGQKTAPPNLMADARQGGQNRVFLLQATVAHAHSEERTGPDLPYGAAGESATFTCGGRIYGRAGPWFGQKRPICREVRAEAFEGGGVGWDGHDGAGERNKGKC